MHLLYIYIVYIHFLSEKQRSKHKCRDRPCQVSKQATRYRMTGIFNVHATEINGKDIERRVRRTL